MNTMTVGLAVNTSEAGAGERRAIHLALLALTLAVFALLGKPLLGGLIENARARRLSLEPLFALGLAGAFTASVLATWRGHGAVYYEVCTILLVIYSLGKVVTGEAENRALQAVSLAAAAAETCLVLDAGGTLAEKRIADVRAGDVVAAPAGAAVAVDGIVEQGAALCRVDAITGESFLVAKSPGDAIPAGAVPTDAALWVRASAAGSQRSLDQISAAIARSRAEPSPLERTAARAALWLTPFVAGSALLAGLYWWLRAGADAALMNGLAVLVIACPCALGFATPLALWAAMSRFALRGAFLRNGEALERIAQCGVIVFDKTGTLTGVEPRLESFAVLPECALTREELLEAVEAVERLSGHPIARAFRGCAPGGAARFDVREVRLLPGKGVAAELRGRQGGAMHELRVGLAGKLLAGEDAGAWEELRQAARPAPGARLLAVLLDGRLAALAALQETPMPGLADLWRELQEAGIETILVSGDEAARVQALGHPDARAGMRPLEKLGLVRSLRAQGRKVLFIGDGINDAAAMAESHAALAVESGTALAREVAHGVLRAGAVPRIAELVKIARAARRLGRTNLAYAAAYNLAGIPVAAAGLLHPVFAALVMTCSSLMVVWRAAAFLSADLEAQAS